MPISKFETYSFLRKLWGEFDDQIAWILDLIVWPKKGKSLIYKQIDVSPDFEASTVMPWLQANDHRESLGAKQSQKNQFDTNWSSCFSTPMNSHQPEQASLSIRSKVDDSKNCSSYKPLFIWTNADQVLAWQNEIQKQLSLNLGTCDTLAALENEEPSQPEALWGFKETTWEFSSLFIYLRGDEAKARQCNQYLAIVPDDVQINPLIIKPYRERFGIVCSILAEDRSRRKTWNQ